jgi:hypothetical protein
VNLGRVSLARRGRGRGLGYRTTVTVVAILGCWRKTVAEVGRLWLNVTTLILQ